MYRGADESRLGIRKDSTLLCVLLFASLEFGPYFDAEVYGVKITVFDIALLFALSVSLWQSLLQRRRIGFLERKQPCRIPPHRILVLSLIYFSLIVEVGSLVQDPAFPRNVTLAVAVVRSLVVIFLVSRLSFDRSRLVRCLAITGFLFSLYALILYYTLGVSRHDVIRRTSNLWRIGIGYFYNRGDILRLTGLRADPNFYFIVNVGAFICSFHSFVIRRKLTWAFASLTILVSIVLTFSRSGLVLLGVFLIIAFLRSIWRLAFWFVSLMGVTLLLLAVLLFSCGNAMLAGLFDRGVIDTVLARLQPGEMAVSTEQRLVLWETAWRGFQQSPLFGKGGRYVLRAAGGYVHNDYLEMLSSHGLVGFALMIAANLSVFMVGMKNASRDHMEEPYLWSYVLLVGAELMFTIYYNPFIWLWAALILSRPSCEVTTPSPCRVAQLPSKGRLSW